MNKKLLISLMSLMALLTQAQLNYNSANALNFSGTYTDLAATGNTIAVANTDDANSAAVNIGFTFTYNGTAYTQFVLNTNGFIKLGATAPSTTNIYYTQPQNQSVGGVFANSDINVIAPFNMDLVGLSNAEYRVFTSGSVGSRTTTIQYKNIRDGFTPQYDNINFQIKLHETSNLIDFVYGTFLPSVNPTDYRYTAVGLVGAGGNVIAVEKASVDAWATGTVFLNNNYASNTHNNRNTVLPDVGRTYRFIPTSANDASVKEVYTFGEVSTLYTNPQTVSAYIFNSGLATLATFNATLSVTGANTFTTVASVSGLTSNSGILVSFPSFSNTTIGTNTISVILPNDDNNSNNTKSVTQIVSTSNVNSAYGNVSTGSFGYTSNTGSFDIRYQISAPASLTQVMPSFSSSGVEYYVSIMDNNYNTIYTSATLLTSNGQNTVSISPAVPVVNAFYVRYHQTTVNRMELNVQNENPLRANTFFGNLGDYYGSLNQSRFMSKIVLAAAPAPDVEVREIYTLGEVSTQYNSTQVISAAIKNNGVTTYTSLTATLVISGANNYTATAIAYNLLPGVSQQISFPSFNLTNVGTNSVTVLIPADGNNANNSKTVNQIISTNGINSGYGNVMTGNFGFNGYSSNVKVTYNLQAPAAITQVIPTFSVSGKEYRIRIFDGSNTLYTSGTLTTTAGQNTVVISPTIGIAAGNFYVYYDQINTSSFQIGVQNENPVRSNVFYSEENDISNTANQFRIMSKVQLTSVSPPEYQLQEIYTLGEVSSAHSNPIGISASIKNNGGYGANTTATLSVTGANTYSTTVFIPSISGGLSSEIFFGSVPINNIGTNTISILLPLDANNANNTKTITQVVTNYEMNYAYGNTVNSGINFLAADDYVFINYNVSSVCQISQVVPTFSVGGAQYKVYINDGNNSVYASATTLTATAGANTVIISPPVNITSGAATVFFQQIGNTPLNLGLQNENPVRNNTFGANFGGSNLYFKGHGINSRIMSKIVFAPPAPADLTIAQIYAMGTVAVPFGNPQTISAYINNLNLTPAANVTVTLSITGANTYSATQIVSVLGNSTNNTLVTFNGFNPTNVGTNTITILVPADANNANNSSSIEQLINTNSFNYGYSVGTIAGAGFSGGTGDIATKFTTNSQALISQLKTGFFSNGEPVTLSIFNDASGVPGTAIFTSSVILTNSATPMVVSVNPPVSVNGTFYVIVSQTGTNSIGVSYQNEAPIRPNTFFYAGPTGSGLWTDFTVASLNYRIMVEPVFGTCTPPAQPGVISGTNTVCANSANIYSVTAVSGATSYVWNLPIGWSGSSTTNTISVTANSNSGVISVSASNGCASPSRTMNINVTTIPAQPTQVFGNSSVCSGSSQTYSVNAISGATSYNWTLPSGWSGSSTTNTIAVSTGTAGGSIIASANNGCGLGSPQFLTVSISAGTPTQPTAITGLSLVCQSTSQTYSVAPVSGASNYNWVLPSGWSGNSTSNIIVATVGANSGTVSVIASNGCGNSSAQTISVTVNNLPSQAIAIIGANSLCSGATPTYSVAADPLALSYTWVLPVSWSGISTTNTIATTAGLSGTISVTANNTCGSSATQTIAVAINSGAPTAPSAISGNSVVCETSPQTYSVTNDPLVATYSWTLPSGWIGSSSTNVINVTAGTATGSVSVIAANGCGTTTAVYFAIATINPVPAQPGIISGAASICGSETSTYSVATVTGANDYTWTLESGLSGSSTTNTIAVTVGLSSGTIAVVANNVCGSSPAQVYSITVNAGPTLTVQSLNATICVGESVTINASGAITYSWSTGATNSSIVVAPTTTTIYSVVGTTNGCSNSTTFTQNVSTCTGIDAAANKTNYVVYPNPSNGLFNIEMNTELTSPKVLIYNELGQVVYESTLTLGTNSIKLETFAPGMYQLSILSELSVKFRTKIVID